MRKLSVKKNEAFITLTVFLILNLFRKKIEIRTNYFSFTISYNNITGFNEGGVDNKNSIGVCYD